MRLVTFESGSGPTPGVLVGSEVYDLGAALAAVGISEERPASVRQFLEKHGGRMREISASIAAAIAGGGLAPTATVDDLRLLPPVVDPSKVLCIGLNYLNHVIETSRDLPTHPDVFSKFDTSLVGPSDDIAISSISDNLDFEGELAIVIGRAVRDVPESAALAAVAGLTVLNDISARDLQYRGTQWLVGKAVDRSTPMGPALVTLDEIPDVQQLDIATRLNGIEVQHSTTERMIFPVAAIVAYLSTIMQLRPGDVIATGTPEGIGAKRTPQLWMRPGDRIEVEVEHVGRLSNLIK